MTQYIPLLLYVHDYSNWHIAPQGSDRLAFCGAYPSKADWASRRHFDKADLVVDDRTVCGVCLYHMGAIKRPGS